MHVRHYHLSGRFSRPGKAVLAHLNQRKPTFDIATFTEVANDAHRRALRDAFDSKDWHLVHVGHDSHMGECAIAVRKSIGSESIGVVDFGVHQPAPDTTYYRPDGGRVHPGYVVWVVLEAIGVRSYVTVAHMPVHADARNGLHGLPRRVATYVAWLRGWRDFSERQRRRYHVSRHNTLMTADWNLNMSYPWVRLLLRRYWPVMRVTWPMPVGRKSKLYGRFGTIGNKVIDASVTGAKVVKRPHVRSDPHDASDHRPYVETLDLFTSHKRKKASR